MIKEIKGDLCHELLVRETEPALAFDENGDLAAQKRALHEKLRELTGLDRIEANACPLNIDFEETVVNHGFGFIGKDGEIFARESCNGHNFIKDEHYEEKVREAIKDVQDCYVTYVDCHG